MNINQVVRKRTPFVLGFTAGIMLLVAFLWFGRSSVASANSNDLGNWQGKYPAAIGSVIDTCTLCHTAKIPGLNPYGTAYKSNGRSAAALTAIESLDSDGDGFTNIQEIKAFTFPGDPNSHPAGGPNPTATPTATATKMASPTPTSQVSRTATKVASPTSTKQVSPTKAGSPTPVVKTPTPGGTRVPRHTRTPRPTTQPTPCVRNGEDGSSSGDRSDTHNSTGSPEDRRGGSQDCRPSEDGSDGGSKGSDESGLDGLTPLNHLFLFVNEFKPLM